MLDLLFAKVPGTTFPYDLEQYLQDAKQLKWYIVPIFVITVYIIVSELKKRNYSVVLGGLAFWLMDVFNETWNSMVYATTGQPVWGTTMAGGSALQILVGYNIEISFMFFILGITACKMLATTNGYEGELFCQGNANWFNDKHNMYYKAGVKSKDLSEEERKIKRNAVLGRIIPALVGSALAVVVEILLNACGVLTWEKSWWQASMPVILYIIGYCPFFFAAVCVHDLPRKWQFVAVGIIAAVVVVLLVVAGSLDMLGAQTDGAGNWVGRWWKQP